MLPTGGPLSRGRPVRSLDDGATRTTRRQPDCRRRALHKYWKAEVVARGNIALPVCSGDAHQAMIQGPRKLRPRGRHRTAGPGDQDTPPRRRDRAPPAPRYPWHLTAEQTVTAAALRGEDPLGPVFHRGMLPGGVSVRWHTLRLRIFPDPLIDCMIVGRPSKDRVHRCTFSEGRDPRDDAEDRSRRHRQQPQTRQTPSLLTLGRPGAGAIQFRQGFGGSFRNVQLPDSVRPSVRAFAPLSSGLLKESVELDAASTSSTDDSREDQRKSRQEHKLWPRNRPEHH